MSKNRETTSEAVYNIRHQVNRAYKHLKGSISKPVIRNHYGKKDELLFKQDKKKLQRDIKKLNQQQHRIVTSSKYGSYLVNASAGSGKTRVLVTRIAYLCIHEHVQPKKILAVTFTNNAVDQIRSRCKDLMGEMLANQLHICTFHSFASKVLRQFHSFDNWALCSDHHANSIVAYWLVRYAEKNNETYTHARKSIRKRAIPIVVTKISKAINYLRPQNKCDVDPQIDYVYYHFIQALKHTHEYSFSYMLYEAVHLLQNNQEYVKKLQSKYHYALIDEFQDTSLAEYKLLYPIFHDVKDHYVMAVGDPHQRIYDFAGADGRLPAKLIRDYHITDDKQCFMEENFRSTRNIVKAGNAINSMNGSQTQAFTRNDKGNPVGVYKFKSVKQEAKVLADYIRASHLYNPTDKGSESKIAVLAPHKSSLLQLQKGLVANHIKCFVVTTGSLVSGQRVGMLFDCLYMIHSKSDIYSSMDFINHATNMGIGKKTAHKWFRVAYDCNTNNIFDPRVIKEFMTFASKKAQKTVKYLITRLNKWRDYAQRAPIKGLLKWILESIGGYMPQPYSDTQLNENLKVLLALCKLFQEDHKPNSHSVEDFLNFFAQQYETTRDKGKGIPLETIHSSKGGQWDLTFLVGIEETDNGRGFPSADMMSKPKTMKIGYNEMYVAITRARRHLCICAANLPYTQTRVSRFATDMNDMLEKFGFSKFYKM